MAQRRKTSGELSLAGESAIRADTDDPSAPELTPAAEVVPLGAFETQPKGLRELEGRLVGVEKDRIAGWAWDAAKPYEAVEVELYIGEMRVGRGAADVFDMELVRAKRGNGMHRFELGLDRLPSTPPPYEVRAVIADSEFELLPPVALTTLEEAERLLSGTEYLGKVTGVSDGMLCGWVLNWHNPHEEPVLTLRDGSTDVFVRQAKERTTAVIDNGVTVNAYRFELPLPANVLDGNPHCLSVVAGSSIRELSGSPVLFGPADVGSLGRNLAATFERQQELERKISSLQPGLDNVQLERRITIAVLDRIDMLLNIHRDALERELAVLRRQVAELMRLSPQAEPDVIRPSQRTATIEDETLQPAKTFSVMARSAPLVSFDLQARPSAVKPSAGLKWSDSEDGLAVIGSGDIELDGVPAGPASIVLRGTGATDAAEFCAIVPTFHGRQLEGHVELGENGSWSLIGTTIAGSVDEASARGIAIEYLPNIATPSGKLGLNQIAVFHRGRVPERVDPQPPQAQVLYVGTDRSHNGWYAIESGPRGGLCWMSAEAQVAFRVRQSPGYQLTIPEIRPLVPGIMSNLAITLGGVPVRIEVSPMQDDKTVFRISGTVRAPLDETGNLVLRLSFPGDCVRSPVELGLNDDQRPLSIAVRAIALSAIET